MRLFIGIALDDELRLQLKRQADKMRTYMRGNFSLCDNYHVTLAFLGQHDESELPAVKAAMTSAALCKSFDICIRGWGTFVKGNRQIVWAGVKQSSELCVMQRALVRELHARDIAFNDEGAYTPHVTIARQCAIMPLPCEGVNIRQRVRAITLFESARRDGVLRYSPLAEASLFH